jgi:DNA repair protein RadC
MPTSVRKLSEDGPREKLARAGVSSLGDDELLALVLGHGAAKRSALTIARELLAVAGGLHGLARTTGSLFDRAAGVGSVQAGRVLAAVELGRRTLLIAPEKKLPLHEPLAFARLLLPRFGAHPVERMGVVLLDTKHRLIRVHLVSEGGLDQTLGVPRDVFREATIAGASAVALFHNHPSGDPTPSRDDVLLTRRIAEAGEIVGIDVIEHIVLADASYYSMKTAKLF